MGKETAISWTDSTFNPWWGCTPISPGCAHCYAATLDHRTGGDCFGAGKTRRTFGEKHWNDPLRWNKAAEKEGKPRLVFVASMADVFDAEAPAGELEKLWDVIRKTPHLIWQILTKRADRIAMSLPSDWGEGFPNVWLGVTAENQEMADARIPLLLLDIKAAKRFVSLEPLLGPVDLARITILEPEPPHGPGVYLDALRGHVIGPDDMLDAKIDWVIAGGETGPGARPMNPEWARSLRDQCQAAGVPFFFKQWGEWGPMEGSGSGYPTPVCFWNSTRSGTRDGWIGGVTSEATSHVVRVGKKAAGRELDGRTWEEMPEVAR